MKNEIQRQFNLLWSPLFSDIVENNGDNDALYIVAPFIQHNALAELLTQTNNYKKLQVITRWNAADILSGVSDLEVYPYLKKLGIPLYIHPKIHLKLLLFESNEIFHCSGNITNTGLGINCVGNIEVGSYIQSSLNDWKHLYQLIDESRLVTDEVYEKALGYKRENMIPKEPLPELDLFSLKNREKVGNSINLEKKPFSMGSLPALESPETFLTLYSKNSIADICPGIMRLLFHDIALFNIDLNLERDTLLSTIKLQFKQLPFILSFVDFLKENKSLRFGAVTAWIHNKCTDVPLPYRKEIKEHVNHLYNWLSFCFEEISWNIPGARSQVIYWDENLSITHNKIDLPFYPDLKLACGVFSGESASFASETIEIENPHGNLDPKKHFIVCASGDSMDGGKSPIKNGDVILLELNTGGTISNQIFAVEYLDEFGEASYVLKRIEKSPGGNYTLVSANRNYPPINVDPEKMKPLARFIRVIRE